MVKSILKGENLRRTLFAFLKANNAFYNYMDAFYNFHYLRSEDFMTHPSFNYFFDFCSNRDEPTELIFNAFNWSDTKEGISYWRSLYNKFSLFCKKIREEEDNRKYFERMIKELYWPFVYNTNTDTDY